MKKLFFLALIWVFLLGAGTTSSFAFSSNLVSGYGITALTEVYHLSASSVSFGFWGFNQGGISYEGEVYNCMILDCSSGDFAKLSCPDLGVVEVEAGRPGNLYINGIEVPYDDGFVDVMCSELGFGSTSVPSGETRRLFHVH